MLRGDHHRLTEVEATPSQPPGALVEVQSPIVAACEPLPSDVASLLPELVFGDVEFPFVDAPFSELASCVEGVVEVEESVAVPPGCWHCQEASGAQEPSTCSRHWAYAIPIHEQSLR